MCPSFKDASATAARGVALFFALFTGTNLIGEWFVQGFDANDWWLRLPEAANVVEWLAFGAFALLAGAFGIWPRMGKTRRRVTAVVFGLTGTFAIGNGASFLWLTARGTISAGMILPFSLLVAGSMFWLARICWSGKADAPNWFATGGACASCLVLFPLLQMVCFGKTDYRRQADAAVILGARVYADGTLSDALMDRVNTGCELYRQGLVRKLVMSGGPGDGAIHETEAMTRFAISQGVAERDILVDVEGVNTQATVRNTSALFAEQEFTRVLAVSHFYHLPRVKLAYARAGWEVYTVPAHSPRMLAMLPYFMAREAAALAKYYFTPAAAG